MGMVGTAYLEGAKNERIKINAEIAEAVEEERLRMVDVNRAVLDDAKRRIAALEELKDALEQENAQLDELADNDNSTTGLSASRLLRINQIRSQPK